MPRSDADRFFAAWESIRRHGGSQSDVATVLGITPLAVRQRAFQLRKKGIRLKPLNGRMTRAALRKIGKLVNKAVEGLDV